MNVSLRMNQAYYEIEELRPRVGMAELLKPNAAKPVLAAVEALHQCIAELRVTIETALHPPAEGRQMDHKAATDSLVGALTKIAKSNQALRVPVDTIRDLVIDTVDTDDRPFWMREHAQYIRGLIQNDERTKALLKSADILCWTNDVDREVRLVDARWCETPAQIADHVRDTSIIGRRCRFCRMAELDTSPTLQAVDPDKRRGYDMHNDRYVLQVGVVNTHEQCRPFWEKWVDIATEHAKG